ncbi:hypothetical protein VMCG_02833 [Cytospora schulzeri]|uniref:Uncharacterized protein n=1 Tax=Cytospora schulzeri TaxID=448051 RepID=A0A423X024_9PEZI|nr:hypothetical protein VMCG_02833 [Valsa malicola]
MGQYDRKEKSQPKHGKPLDSGASKAGVRPTPGVPGWKGPGYIHKKKKKPQPATEAEAAGPLLLDHVLPAELEQLILEIFRATFPASNDFEALKPTLQEVRDALARGDLEGAFGREEFLEAYAIRWSPSRALAYAQLLTWICKERGDDACLGQLVGGGGRGDELKSARAVCFGGGAAEIMAFSAALRHLRRSSAAGRPERSSGDDVSDEMKALSVSEAASSSSSPTLLDLQLLDTADWSSVLSKLYTGLTTPPTLSKYASAAARAANASFLSHGAVRHTFTRTDILGCSTESLSGTIGTDPALLTLFLTLNDLYTASMPRTTAFLLRLTEAAPKGSMLLVVDAPGVYSEVAGGDAKEGEERKKYPLTLRELNSNFPSPVTRHKYTKSTGAQSSTYSQPVIVRTYTGPSPSQGHSRSNSYSARRVGHRRGLPSTTSTSISYVSPLAHSRPTGAPQNGGLLNMARENAKKMPWPWKQGQSQEDAADRLPPHEAFSFKAIMANLQAESNEMDKALDGIAEIYARSRYSLSNQYEVHVAPHGSGASFISAVPSSSSRRRGHAKNRQSQNGPTLQAIQSDDDDNSASARTHRKRKSIGRRSSAAYGTLETIMSSSRSSEDDKSKKRSASELMDEVRGRASSKPGRSSSGSPIDAKEDTTPAKEAKSRRRMRKGSKSFANAIIHADSSKQHSGGGEAAPPRGSAAALLSKPSMPQTSSSHLEIRTTPNGLLDNGSSHSSQRGSPKGSKPLVPDFAGGLRPPVHRRASDLWKTELSVPTSQPNVSPATRSHAEGSLRELLKTVDVKRKGKSVEHLEQQA